MANSCTRKRRHHYVWKDYLRAWAHGEKIFCLLRGKLLDDKLENVAQERDFYELKALSEDDVAFLRTFVMERAMPHLRALHENALRLYLQAQEVSAVGRRHATTHPDLGKAADVLASNLTEDWHSSVERSAAAHLQALRGGNAAFYEDRDACRDFTLFLATQYFRTKAIKNAVVTSMQLIAGKADVARSWDLMAHMFSINVAWSLFAARTTDKLKILRNETDLDFITSDQPVVNAAAKDLARDQAPDHLTLYYPVSPRTAVLVGDRYSGSDIGEMPTQAEVGILNALVARRAHLRIFARQKNDLVAVNET